MSIVQSAMERLKKQPREAELGGALQRAAADAEAGPAGVVRSPQRIAWPTDTSPVRYDAALLRERAFYPSEAFARRVAEDFRKIRREVIAASRARPDGAAQPVGPIIVVTSALPGDGKTFSAANLALSLASEGLQDVLLIDADCVRRTLSRSLGLEQEPGLLDVLAHPESNPFGHVHRTTTDRLYFLPAGSQEYSATDLMTPGRLGPVLSQMRDVLAGHFVVIDTAPILLSSETPVLTDQAGQVLFVVRAGQTLEDSVREGIARINQVVPVGLILNAWSPVLPSEKRAYEAFADYAK